MLYALTTFATAGILISWLWGAPEPKKKEISASSYGSSWPFTVKKGKLFCEDITKVQRYPQQAILFESEGATYALNGSAKTAAQRDNKKWRDAREITKNNPMGAGWGIMDVTPLIQEGLKLCPKK